jgi:hypothetical protein
MSNDVVSIRRYTGAAINQVDADLLVRLMTQQGPEDGDFLVIRAEPSRARSLENALRMQLMPWGVAPQGMPSSVARDDG